MTLSRWCGRRLADSFLRRSGFGPSLALQAANPVSASLRYARQGNGLNVFTEGLREQRYSFSSGGLKKGAESSADSPGNVAEISEKTAQGEGTSSERLAQLEQQVKELHDIMAEYERHMKEYVLEKVLDIEDEMREVRRGSGVQTVQHQSSVEKAEVPTDAEYVHTSTGVHNARGTSETWRELRDANTIDVAVVHISSEQQREPSGSKETPEER